MHSENNVNICTLGCGDHTIMSVSKYKKMFIWKVLFYFYLVLDHHATFTQLGPATLLHNNNFYDIYE